MKMWTQANRRRGRKNQTNIARRIKGNTTHTEAKMCICLTRSALNFSLYLSALTSQPPVHALCLSLCFFPILIWFRLLLLFLVSLLIFTNGKKGQLANLCSTLHNAHDLHPLEASSHRHLFVTVFLLVFVCISSNQSFSLKPNLMISRISFALFCSPPAPCRPVSLEMFLSPYQMYININHWWITLTKIKKRKKNFSSYNETRAHARTHASSHKHVHISLIWNFTPPFPWKVKVIKALENSGMVMDTNEIEEVRARERESKREEPSELTANGLINIRWDGSVYLFGWNLLDCFQKEEFHSYETSKVTGITRSLSSYSTVEVFRSFAFSVFVFAFHCIYVFIGKDTVY